VKKTSTVAKRGNQIVEEPKLTIGGKAAFCYVGLATSDEACLLALIPLDRS
jgi:hypothetical protein